MPSTIMSYCARATRGARDIFMSFYCVAAMRCHCFLLVNINSRYHFVFVAQVCFFLVFLLWRRTQPLSWCWRHKRNGAPAQGARASDPALLSLVANYFQQKKISDQKTYVISSPHAGHHFYCTNTGKKSLNFLLSLWQLIKAFDTDLRRKCCALGKELKIIYKNSCLHYLVDGSSYIASFYPAATHTDASFDVNKTYI